MIWKEITLEEKKAMDAFYEYRTSMGCEQCFANNFLWAPYYETKVGYVEECMVFYTGKKDSVSFPIGPDPWKALAALREEYRKDGRKFRMGLVTPQQFERLEQKYPGIYQIQYERNCADYIYESKSLIELTGKKLHAKRNHINRFRENHPDWSFEVITSANVAECVEMAEEWRMQHPNGEDPDVKTELTVTLKALHYREELGLDGGLLRAGGKVLAFALGEPVTDDAYVVHIEKAFGTVQGAYPMINREFAAQFAGNYTYVNREEDMGEEGLRKAKLSYNPAILYEKGTVTLLEER